MLRIGQRIGSGVRRTPALQWSHAPQARHESSFLGAISNWLQRLQDTRGWRDGRTYVGSDEKGNKYFVKVPTSGMVAETSHCKEIRSIEYAGGNHWKECKCRAVSNPMRPRMDE